MSKASEFSKYVQQRPGIVITGKADKVLIEAHVTNLGRLEMTLPQGACESVELEQDAARKLGHWILDTFGEKHDFTVEILPTTRGLLQRRTVRSPVPVQDAKKRPHKGRKAGGRKR